MRFGYTAHGVLNMGLFVGGGAVAGVTHAWIRRWYEAVLGRPFQDVLPRLAALTRFALDLGEEAHALGKRLGLFA